MRIELTSSQHMPGHLARRFQQIAVAVFLVEVGNAGYDLTPMQFAALTTIDSHPGLDQITLAGLIAYDRTTITGVIDRLVQKGLVDRRASDRDRRIRELHLTAKGRQTLRAVTPAVEQAQKMMVRGLTKAEVKELLRLLQKVVLTGNDLSRAPLRSDDKES